MIVKEQVPELKFETFKFQNWNWNNNWKGYDSRTGIGTIIEMILVPELELEQ